MGLSILLLLRNSWGEVDWILPILNRLKETRPEVTITTVFLADNFYEKRILYPDLFQILQELSCEVICPAQLLKREVDWTYASWSERPIILPRIVEFSEELNETVRNIRELRSKVAGEGDEGEQRLKELVNRVQYWVSKERKEHADRLENDFFDALFEGPLKDRHFALI